MLFKHKRGQVWVETVIYTLIAFTMIGLVLTFARPEIEKIRDNSVIEQSLAALEDMDTVVSSLDRGGPGNKRIVTLTVKQGSFIIDGEQDIIFFETESTKEFSEVGEVVNIGAVKALTTRQASDYFVNLTLDYSDRYNIMFNGKEERRTLNKAPTPYTLVFSHEGGSKTTINIELS